MLRAKWPQKVSTEGFEVYFGQHLKISLNEDHFVLFLLQVGLVSTDNISVTKIICHRTFCNEMAFTHSKDNLYYLPLSHLSQIFDEETSPQI